MTNDTIIFEGTKGTLIINRKDKLTRKLAMLIENECFGVKVEEAAKKYGFSRPRFYQIKSDFQKGGSVALLEKKRGPLKNYVRTDTIVNQIIRLRFLDPDSSVEVITQKLKQMGYNISQRSVERTITDYGLQKKTPFLKSEK